jgi:hypothetical protein
VPLRKALNPSHGPPELHSDMWLTDQTRRNHTDAQQVHRGEVGWPAAGTRVGWPPLTFLLAIFIGELGGTFRTLRVMFCSSQFLFCSSTSKTDIQSPERPKFENQRRRKSNPSHSRSDILRGSARHFRCRSRSSVLWTSDPHRSSCSRKITVSAFQLRPDEVSRAER